MKKIILSLFVIVLIVCIIPGNQTSYTWGFFAHKKINRMAVFTLPDEIIGFYKQHLEYITEHAVDPDRRRYSDPDEAPRHFIDMDRYGQFAYDSVPHRWKDAVAKYTEDTLVAYGIVPWQIERIMYRLTDAFRNLNVDQILHYSADLGHYIGDSHVPLHTTSNYNGQQTNQVGIHGFWESRIPELKSQNYDYFVGQAQYIEKPIEKAWSTLKSSNRALDSVLIFEEELNKHFPSDKKYSIENRGNTVVKVYSEEYTNMYNELLNGMVERRFRSAILTVGSMWYTAWVNAGKPDLSSLNNKEISDSLKLVHKANEEKWKNNRDKEIKGHKD